MCDFLSIDDSVTYCVETHELDNKTFVDFDSEEKHVPSLNSEAYLTLKSFL